MPLWITMHRLNFKYQGEESLGLIRSMVGPVLRIGKATTNRDILRYLRIMVEINPDEILIEVFENEKGELILQKIEYD